MSSCAFVLPSLNASKLTKVLGQAFRGQAVDVFNVTIVTCSNRLLSLHDVGMLPSMVLTIMAAHA